MAKKYKYRASFTFEGKRYFVKSNTKADLAVKKAMKLRDLEEGKITVTGTMTVSAWTNRAIETYKTSQKEVTRKIYLGRVEHCILEHIGDMQLKSVKPIHCQNVLNLQQGKSKSQINEVYNALQFIFKKAVANQLIVSNPAENIEKPAGRSRVHRRAITEHEREHILKVAVTDRRYYLYLLMLQCGCRPSEAAEAKGFDISIKQGYPLLHIRGTKSSNAERYVPIPTSLYELIKGTPRNEYIACHSTGSKIADQYRRRLWNSFKRQLNLSMGCKTYRNALVPPFPLAPDLVPYCLRHTYCTDLARSGVDIRMAQKLMGHSDISLTANIYTNLDENDVVKAAEILDDVTLSVPHAR